MSLRSQSLHRFWVCLFALSLITPTFAQDEPGDPPMESILANEPTTTEGYIKATLLMVQLAKPELAKNYLKQLLAANPTDDELLQARDEHGTGTFLSLTRVKELQPQADELLKLINQATLNRVNQPGYVERLIPKLSGTAREREDAFSELTNLGPYAIPPMLKVLQDDVNADRDVLIYNMSRLGQASVNPMIGALQSPSDLVRGAAVEVLGWNGTEDTTDWLWHPAFADSESPGIQANGKQSLGRILYGEARYAARVDPYGSARKMLDTAIDHLAGRYTWPESFGEGETVSIWVWSNTLKTVEEQKVSRRAASIYFAERLAREAGELNPGNIQAPVVLLTALLARDAEQAGWEQPIPRGTGTAFDLAVSVGPELCQEALQLSLDHGITSSALASTQALALNGSANQVRTRTSPIMQALDAPSQRLQYAAAITILQWEPQFSFPQSKRIVEILGRTLNADTKANSVVMDPNIQRGRVTSGLFGELGYDANLAATGMEGFLVAAERGDVELAVLHPNVIKWELSQTIANLRADARTRDVPVVIYGPADIKDRFKRISEEYQQVVFINESLSATDIVRQLQPVLAQVTPPPLSQQQRAASIQESAFWLRRIATCNSEVFDITEVKDALNNALNDPNIVQDAIIAYGSIGEPDVQERLLEMVTAPTTPAETKELAALQLAAHIQKHGGTLSNTSLQAARTAFNNETDPAVQTALAAVIGSLAPTQPAARNEIMKFPASTKPNGSADNM